MNTKFPSPKGDQLRCYILASRFCHQIPQILPGELQFNLQISDPLRSLEQFPKLPAQLPVLLLQFPDAGALARAAQQHTFGGFGVGGFLEVAFAPGEGIV